MGLADTHPRLSTRLKNAGRSMVRMRMTSSSHKKYSPSYTKRFVSANKAIRGVNIDYRAQSEVRYANAIKKIIRNAQKGSKPAKGPISEGGYRNLQKKMDEMVSTSTVRDLLDGIIDAAGPGSPADLANVAAEAFDLISRARAPTGYVGFKFSGTRPSSAKYDEMQHPTSDTVAMFALKANKVANKAHSDLDLKRRSAVTHAIEKSIAAGDSIYETAVSAVRAAIVFTLNAMWAPAIASNIVTWKSKADMEAQARFRDSYKAFALDHLGIKERALPAGASKVPKLPLAGLTHSWVYDEAADDLSARRF